MNKEATKILFEEYTKVAGRIFADWFLILKTNEEEKKSIEAMDFMKGLIEGNIKKEWQIENSEDFILLGKLAKAINKLGEE